MVLRRLEDALADHDHIHAVILGSAINNDGARKVGYLAPSVEGQAEVIAEALDYAGVPAAEHLLHRNPRHRDRRRRSHRSARAHAGISKVARRAAHARIGSLKSNVGHLDAAAGVAGLIKTVLALEHAQIPASLHFEKINPHIELEGSPFYVNSKLARLARRPARRAALASLRWASAAPTRTWSWKKRHSRSLARQQSPTRLLTVSAKTEAAADQAFANLAAHLAEHPEVNLADAAFTCQLGRTAFPHRRALVVEDTRESIAALAALEP